MATTLVNGVQVPFLPAQGVEGLREQKNIELPSERSFENLLQEQIREVKFSKHAQERLDARQIQLNQADISSIQHAVDKAAEKGSQDSLVLLRDMAFIVSVKNRTVVTAMDATRAKDNVFTNIDSAVIAA